MDKFKRFILPVVAIFTTLILAFGFSGCVRLYGNDRSMVAYCQPIETAEEYVYDISAFTYVNQTLNVSKQTGQARIVEGEVKEAEEFTTPENRVLEGNGFPKPVGYCEVKEGYEELPELLTERYEKDNVKYIQYYAVKYGEEVYGFCNLYSNCAGFLFAGGQIACEYIVAGVYFSYDAESKQFTEISKLDKCNVVACNTDSVVYYKNKKYYTYKVGDFSDKFVCADEAYDSGMTNYSYVNFFFNADNCIIIMHKGYSNYKKDYVKIVMCGYDGEVIGEFKLNTNYQ